MSSEDLARAFSDGCDARIKGLPRTTVGTGLTDKHLREYFLSGWDDVDKNFGADAKPSRRTPLPEVG